jgi:hypothetical protein
MDTEMRRVLRNIGIDPNSVPPGSVKLLTFEEIASLGERLLIWARNSNNVPALAYAVETEHNPFTGLLLRNLQNDPSRKSIQMVTKGEGPFWHNFHFALPTIYDKGVIVLVEGPKDAQNDIPAVAYLGISPGHDHLKVIKRYADVILWIPDNDETNREGPRKRKVYSAAAEMNLKLVEFAIPTKDAGDLARDRAWLERIKSRVNELASFL